MSLCFFIIRYFAGKVQDENELAAIAVMEIAVHPGTADHQLQENPPEFLQVDRIAEDAFGIVFGDHAGITGKIDGDRLRETREIDDNQQFFILWGLALEKPALRSGFHCSGVRTPFRSPRK
ncbi:MAG: hypothetical protein ACD_75C00476G0003 [uncultured bacterium]|nr:MAG: hypothetical protein ACD_75C00476G0003 [uncultured bacterium]